MPEDLPTPAPLASARIRYLNRRRKTHEITLRIAERLGSSRRQPPRSPDIENVIWWLGNNEGASAGFALAGWAAIMNIVPEKSAAEAIRGLERRGAITVAIDAEEWTIALTAEGEQLLFDLREEWQQQPDEDHYTFTDDPPRLVDLKIEGFKCFKTEQRLSFCEEGSDTPARWTVLVGENGVGKTTLLKCIAALYPKYDGPSGYDVVAENSDFAASGISAASSTSDNTIVECTYHVRPTENTISPIIAAVVKSSEKYSDYISEVHVELSCTTSTGSRGGMRLVTGHAEYFAAFPLLVGYGASRYIGGSRLSPSDDSTGVGIRSLFEDDAPLKNPEEWLLQADYSARFTSKHKRSAERRLERVKLALVRLLPGVTKVSVAAPDESHESPYVSFQTPFGKVDLAGLSYGYQSTIAWIVDFATRLFDRYDSLDNPLEGPALVLLDEMDLHAHPKWQREIMQHLERVFPNTQFVTTTHSPVVLQGSRNVNIALLKRDGAGVRIVNDLDELREWRVDQILTSDLFGLESAAPDYIREMEKRRVDLLKKPTLLSSEERELAVIEDALARLPLSTDHAAEKARRLILDFASRLDESHAENA